MVLAALGAILMAAAKLVDGKWCNLKCSNAVGQQMQQCCAAACGVSAAAVQQMQCNSNGKSEIGRGACNSNANCKLVVGLVDWVKCQIGVNMVGSCCQIGGRAARGGGVRALVQHAVRVSSSVSASAGAGQQSANRQRK